MLRRSKLFQSSMNNACWEIGGEGHPPHPVFKAGVGGVKVLKSECLLSGNRKAHTAVMKGARNHIDVVNERRGLSFKSERGVLLLKPFCMHRLKSRNSKKKYY